MSLSKKHFKAIAEIIKRANLDAKHGNDAKLVLSSLEIDLCHYFMSENSAFDSGRFREACK